MQGFGGGTILGGSCSVLELNVATAPAPWKIARVLWLQPQLQLQILEFGGVYSALASTPDPRKHPSLVQAAAPIDIFRLLRLWAKCLGSSDSVLASYSCKIPSKTLKSVRRF